jgi:hypothetical protein
MDDVERAGLVLDHLEAPGETRVELAAVRVIAHEPIVGDARRRGLELLALRAVREGAEEGGREGDRDGGADADQLERARARPRRRQQRRGRGVDHRDEADAAQRRVPGDRAALGAGFRPVVIGQHDVVVVHGRNRPIWCKPLHRAVSAAVRGT